MDQSLWLDELLLDLWFAGPLLWFLTGVLWLALGRGRVSSILGGLGLLLLAGCLLTMELAQRTWRGEAGFEFLFDAGPRLFTVLGYATLFAQLLLLAGIACLRVGSRSKSRPDPLVASPAPAPAEAAAAPVHGHGPPAPLASPGWGLAGTWIALSSVCFVVGIVALALTIAAGGRPTDDEAIAMIAAYAIAALSGIPAIVLFYVWLHRVWSAVPPEHRGTSPGKAVGFCFIPFFNLYWVFRAVPGLSASLGRARAALEPGVPAGSGYGLGITACVIALIPYLGGLSWFFFLAWVVVANGACNRLLRLRAAAEPARPAGPGS